MWFFKTFLQRSGILSITGVVAEFNPLHKGHEYLLNTAGKDGAVVCAISGNFVQRGSVAVIEKRIRAKQALLSGADLVVEIPVLWSMSTAQNFALAGVTALYSAGCDTLIFGSECGEIEPLLSAADILLSKEFSEKLAFWLKKGITFAAAREKAAAECGLKAGILSKPNNNLAVEYIVAAKQNGYDFKFKTIKRKGADHDSKNIGEFVSASLLREKLEAGDIEFCREYMSETALSCFSAEDIADIKRLERAVLATLRTKRAEEFKTLPDLSEGVENKLFSAIKTASSLSGLYQKIKVKRYTLARIRRLVLSAFIGEDNEFFMKKQPYVRVLGFSPKGKEILRKATAKSDLPLVTKVSQIKELGAAAEKVFENECRATDLFSLALEKPMDAGLEYTAKIIKTE